MVSGSFCRFKFTGKLAARRGSLVVRGGASPLPPLLDETLLESSGFESHLRQLIFL